MEYETGAVRSDDLAKERWDLISYRALHRLSNHLLDNHYSKSSLDQLLGLSQNSLYSYLWEDRTKSDHLVIGFVSLAIACQKMLCKGCCTTSNFTLCANLPYHPLQMIAMTCHEGAVKYGEHNWLKGFPIESLLNHGAKHIVQLCNNHTDENHWGHALWVFMAAIEMEETRPDMCRNLLENGKPTEYILQKQEEFNKAKRAIEIK